MAKVELKKASKAFGTNSVIEGLDLSIREREFFCLVGPSGCGKTTVLNLIAGLERPDSGEVLFDGKPVTALGPRERDVAMVFQNYALYPHMTVRENLAFPLKVRKAAAAEVSRRVGETSKLLGLDALLDRRPKQLSGGQQQRVALGRALIRRPRAFLMDEPLSNLDAKLRTQMRTELKRLHQEVPATTVYVTHDQEEALSLSDRMAVMKGGAVQQVGSPEEVYSKPANVFVAGFLGKPEMNIVEVAVDSGAVTADGFRLEISRGLSAALDKAAKGGRAWLGVRPEHVRFSGSKSGGIEVLVEVVEPMGSETWVKLKAGPNELMARAPGRFQGRPGSKARVELADPELHFFNRETEARLDL